MARRVPKRNSKGQFVKTKAASTRKSTKARKGRRRR